MTEDDELAGMALRAAVSCREAALRHHDKPEKADAFRRAAALWDEEAAMLRKRAAA